MTPQDETLRSGPKPSARAHSQIQLRDISGFVESRHQILLLKPGNRNHWINFAVAHHLNKNYDLAVQARTCA